MLYCLLVPVEVKVDWDSNNIQKLGNESMDIPVQSPESFI